MPIQQWAEDIQREVFEKWQAELPDDEEGFKVFSSPVQENSKILFAGTNPATGSGVELPRKHMARFQKGNFDLPSQHEYLSEDWDLAVEFREGLFAGQENHITQTVATNRWFLHRAETDDIKKSHLEAFNSFCEMKFLEIIERVSPELVLCFDYHCYTFLGSEYGFKEEVKTVKRDDPKDWSKYLIRISDNESPQVMWIPHPTGTRVPDITQNEWEVIRDEIYNRVHFY